MATIALRHRHWKTQSWKERFYRYGTVRITEGRGEFPAESQTVLNIAFMNGFQLTDDGQRITTRRALHELAEQAVLAEQTTAPEEQEPSAESAASTESAEE